MQIPGMIP